MPAVQDRAQANTTCDRCRTLKVKCYVYDPSGGSPRINVDRSICTRCAKANKECTYVYEFKKAGRPPGSKNIPKRPDRASSSSTNDRSPKRHRPAPSSHHSLPHASLSPQRAGPSRHSASTSFNAPRDLASPVPFDYDPDTSFSLIPPSLHLPAHSNNGGQNDGGQSWGPARDSIFGSARTTLEATDNHPSWMSAMLYNGTGGIDAESSEQAQVHGVQAPSHPQSPRQCPEPPAGIDDGLSSLASIGSPVPQVDAIGTWSEFCFFFSLFMRHQHALVPLLHKPTFAMDVLNRRDQRDEAFRGLLFSIVTYTICQCPINVMSNDFTRERLHELLGKCQPASRIVQLRHISKPNLVIGASTCLDILSSQATNKPDLTAALFSDAQRIIYSLKLNLEQPSEGLSSIELEISRRVFWQIYNTDKTNVMNGGHMLVPDHEGVPPIPLEVDDDYLSSSGHHPPSHHRSDSTGQLNASVPGKLSYMSGYVAVVQIFRILGECQLRHRTLLNDPSASQSMDILVAWLEHAFERLRKITRSLPGLRDDPLNPAGGQGSSSTPKLLGVSSDLEADATAAAGIQQANIIITALCAEFALLDFKAALTPEEDLMAQREEIAKKAYSTLSSIPIEYLASNGEAMRGKVLRTILALFSASSSPRELGGSVWDWWSMYSQVQFIQVIPAG